MSVHTIVNWVIKNFLTNLDDKMVGWYHQPNGHETEQTLGDSKGQGRPTCCSPWGRKKSDTTNTTYVGEVATQIATKSALQFAVERIGF